MSRKNVTKVVKTRVSGVRFRVSAFWSLASRFWLLAGTVNRLNVEHRTPNIERPILTTLRFIDFKTSEPQNFEE
jgi:hypothetical protein